MILVTKESVMIIRLDGWLERQMVATVKQFLLLHVGILLISNVAMFSGYEISMKFCVG
jgi:hypothetical protein